MEAWDRLTQAQEGPGAPVDRVSAAPRPRHDAVEQTAVIAGGHAVPYLGLRRVTSVRIMLTDAGPVCEVTGIGHRAPTTRRIALATATRLAAAGVPTLVRRASAPRPEGH